MSVWIKLDADYPTHPKTLRLCRLLGDVADAYPIRLWTWCARYAKDGRPDLQLVEDACRWKGETGALISALTECGFLDADGSVHDWNDWTGEFLDQLQSRRDRQKQAKKKRRRQVGDVGEKSARRLGEVGDQKEKEKEKETREDKKEKESTTSSFGGGTGDPPAQDEKAGDGKLFPGPKKHPGLSPGAVALVAYLDQKLRKRDPALALPAKLPRDDAVIACLLAAENDPARLKYTIWWAFQEPYWEQNIAGLSTLAGAWKKLIAQSAKTWGELQHERELWDEPIEVLSVTCT